MLNALKFNYHFLSLGKWHTQGIVSWGFECAHKIYPGVYANVTFFKNWIINSILEKSDPF